MSNATEAPTYQLVPVTYLDTLVFPWDPVEALTPLLVGLVLSSLLLGVLIHQSISYGVVVSRNEGGPRVERFIVSVILIVSVGSFCVQIYNGHMMLVQKWGQPMSVLTIHYSSWLWLGAGVVVGATSQAFFAIRAWQLWHNSPVVGGFLVLGALVGTGAGLASSIKGQIFSKTMVTTDVFVALKTYATVTFVWGAVFDLFITSLISYKLVTMRKGFSHETDSLLYRLLSLSLTTCALTTAMALALAVSVIVGGNAQSTFTALTYLPPRLFAISVLFTLLTKELMATWASSSGSRHVTGTVTPHTNNGTRSRLNNQIRVDRVELVTIDRGHESHSFSAEADDKSDGPRHRLAPVEGPATPGV